jgi:hypothetical protein
MRRSYIIILLILLSFGLKAQVYQSMPQAGYGPVKRFLTDSVLTIPLNINALRNITGGRDAGQIRYNVTDSGLYVYSGYQWIKANLDSTNISNRINGKLNISDTAQMLSVYLRKLDTASLSNRIDARVKYSDTAQMLSVYLRKLDTASLSNRIDAKQNAITLTTNFKSGPSTLVGSTLNIPKYSDTLSEGYVPYSGANKNVALGSYNLTGTLLNADFSLQIKNEVGAGGGSTLGYTSISSNNTGYYFYTSFSGGQKGAYFNYPTSGTTFSYNLPVRAGTLALVEDTVNLSSRINLKADKATTLTINGTTYDLSSNRTWTIPTVDTTSLSNRINLRVKYSDTAAMLSPYLKAAVTSVGLSMPSAFTVTNSPITSTGTLTVTGAGTAAQYIRGDGQLATLPSGASGGSSVAYYLNGSVNQGTIGGSVYYQMNKTPIIGAGTDFSLAGNGLISQFITDVADPNRLQIPAGNWNFEMYMSASSSGGTPEFYVELLKYDGTNFTSIASSSANPEAITNGTTIDLYVTALAIPQTTLLATDRLVIRVYIVNSTGGRTITMHTENSHLCEIITNFAGGVSALNGLTANTQYLATGTSGNDFAINSLTDTHTFNLPTASATKRGALSSADWSTFNGKMNYSDTAFLSNRINLKLSSSDTVSLSNRINTKLNSADTASLSNRINAKADALSGTTNTVAKFTSGTTIGNSNIKDDGSAVSISTTAGSNGALQVGNYNGNILMNTTNSSAGLIFQNTSSSNKLWDISSFNNDLNFNESNISPTVMTLKAGGNVIISSLIGSGTRMVVADATGVLSTQTITGVDTTSLSNRINLKLNISDTASMLSAYQSAINSKQGTITLTTTGTSGAANFSSNTLNIPQYQAAGTYVTSVTGTSPIVSSGGTTPAISIPAATSSVNGYLSSTDWSTFNGKESVLTFSSPLVRTTNTISIPVATTSVNGYLSSTDWTTFNNKVSTATLSGYLPLTGGTLTGALGGTTATFSGTIASTVGNNGALLSATTATTGYQYIDIITTSGRTQLIQESSVAGTTITNSTAYASMFGSAVAKDLILFTNGANRLKIDGSTGAATFSSSGVIGGSTYAPNQSMGGPASSGTTQNGSFRIRVADNAVLDFGMYASGGGAWLQTTNQTGLDNYYNLILQPNGGNTLIGTSTDAGYKLDVNGTGRFTRMIVGGTATSRILQVNTSGNDGIRIITSGDNPTLDLMQTAATNANSRNWRIVSNWEGWGTLDFQSGTTNTQDPATTRLSISGTNGATTLSNLAGTGSRAVLADANGLLSAPVSDSSVKENIKPLDYGIATIMKLKPVSFEYIKSYKNYGQGKQIGNIAQDMAKVIPEAVFTTPSTGKMGINYDQLNGVYIKALQELQEQINILKLEIQTLKNK